MFIVSVKRYLNGANSAHMILPSLCFSAGMSRLHFIVLFLRNPHYSVLTNVDFFSSVSEGSKVLQNDEFTKDLFRFLQLLCEGHNNGKSDTLETNKLETTQQTNT